MKFADWQAEAIRLDKAANEARRVCESQPSPERAARLAAREHGDLVARHYTIAGSPCTVHVSGGGRWVSISQPSNASFCVNELTSVEHHALYHTRRAVEGWQAGALSTLPPSTCDQYGKPLPPARVSLACGCPNVASGRCTTSDTCGCPCPASCWCHFVEAADVRAAIGAKS